MLDRPPVTDEQLSTCARQAYGIDLREITFLPIGYDANAVAHRLRCECRGLPWCSHYRGLFSQGEAHTD